MNHTTASAAPAIPSAASILKAADEAMKRHREGQQATAESIGEWMRSKGMPPETHVLCMPEAWRGRITQSIGDTLPEFMRISALVERPLIVTRI